MKPAVKASSGFAKLSKQEQEAANSRFEKILNPKGKKFGCFDYQGLAAHCDRISAIAKLLKSRCYDGASNESLWKMIDSDAQSLFGMMARSGLSEAFVLEDADES